MPVLGITGGIGSGKSTFRRLLLERLPAESFDADACARELLDGDEAVRAKVTEHVHPEAFGVGGKPNRGLLRDVIYRDEAKKKTLEAILHPVIRDRWSSRARELAAENRLYLVDIPLLFETKAENLFDRIVTVACSVGTQLRRLGEIRQMPREISEKIIASQMPMGMKISRSHHVIWNEGTMASLITQTDLLARILHDRYGG
jgi:dephospho-CoA kinase